MATLFYSRWLLCVALAFASLLQALPAVAQSDEDAQHLTELGMKSFRAADYDAALAQFEHAYRLSRLPLLLYDMAQAERLRGDCAHALALYQEFLATDPAGKAKELAELRVAELASCEPAMAATSPIAPESTSPIEPEPAKEVPAPRRVQLLRVPRPVNFLAPSADDARVSAHHSKRARTWSLLGYGSAAVLLGLSGYFAWRADRAASEVSGVYANHGTWNEALAAKERGGMSDARISIATLAGGLITAGGATWLWTFD